jgi:hypothetical protein
MNCTPNASAETQAGIGVKWNDSATLQSYVAIEPYITHARTLITNQQIHCQLLRSLKDASAAS